MVNYWDTSAIVALILKEDASQILMDLYEDHSPIYTWTLSSIEVYSAIHRRSKMAKVTAGELQSWLKRWEIIQACINYIEAIPLVKKISENVLRVHELKAADSLQLAAAIFLRNPSALMHTDKKSFFLTTDKQLAKAAFKEGFEVLPNTF